MQMYGKFRYFLRSKILAFAAVPYIQNSFGDYSEQYYKRPEYKIIYDSPIRTLDNLTFYHDKTIEEEESKCDNSVKTNSECQHENKRESKINVDMKNLEIGGLSKQMEILIYQVLLSRLLSQDIKDKYDIKDEKGVILYGPPGTGKTLIAKNIAKIVSNSEVIYINGPELQTKYHGGTEENIRKLFDNPKKHPEKFFIMIFDEIDAIGMKRSGDNSDHTGRELTQLLTMIDGINSQSNILIVGITNRVETLDPALTRKGRLGVHIKIPLPDRDGRKDILEIYLGPLQTHNAIEFIDIDYWAEKLEGYSGSDIASFVQQTKFLALRRNFKIVDNIISLVDDPQIIITNDDFHTIYNQKE